MPKLLTKPGRYPAFPFRNWWARTYHGTRGCKPVFYLQFVGAQLNFIRF